MRLYIIRHAQSFNNARWQKIKSDQGRKPDPELTDIGWQQVEAVSQFLAGHHGPASSNGNAAGQTNDQFGFTHLYASLMIRSLDTAAAIAQALDMKPAIWEDLHETGGIYHRDEETNEPTGLPGQNRAFFEANYPDFTLPDSLDGQGWWNNRPFETFEERVERGQRFVKTLLERHGGTEDRVAVVGHGGFYNYILAALLNIPITLPAAAWFVFNNTAITRIDFSDAVIRIAYNNRTDFLSNELIT